MTKEEIDLGDIIVRIGDRYKDTMNRVWICSIIGCTHIIFDQDVIIKYPWHIPSSERTTPNYILTYDEARRILKCPVYNWQKTKESTRTIKY